MTFTIITLTGVSEMIGYGASDEMMKQKVLLRVLISLMLLLQVYLWQRWVKIRKRIQTE
jgi:uncharacterized PurR-regulated membrane protein YhhQ (DUF165 family)